MYQNPHSAYPPLHPVRMQEQFVTEQNTHDAMNVCNSDDENERCRSRNSTSTRSSRWDRDRERDRDRGRDRDRNRRSRSRSRTRSRSPRRRSPSRTRSRSPTPRRRSPPRKTASSIPQYVIRDGIVFTQESFYDFLRLVVRAVNSSGKLTKEHHLNLTEVITDATGAEQARIMLPANMESYRHSLLHCDISIEGLPAAVFFGSGFGSRGYEARASASKDLIDKCLRLGIVSLNTHKQIGEHKELDRKVQLSGFSTTVKAVLYIKDFMSRETWPPEVLTAREMEPYIIDRLRKIMERAVTRATKETEEEQNRLNAPRTDDEPLAEYCSECQRYGHRLEACEKLVKKRVNTPPPPLPQPAKEQPIHRSDAEFLREKEGLLRKQLEEEMKVKQRFMEDEFRARIQKEEREKLERELLARGGTFGATPVSAYGAGPLGHGLGGPASSSMGAMGAVGYPGPSTSLYSYATGSSSFTTTPTPNVSAFGPVNHDFGIGREMGMMWDPTCGSFVLPPSYYAMATPEGLVEIQQVCRLVTDVEEIMSEIQKHSLSDIDREVFKETVKSVHQMGRQANTLPRSQQQMMLVQLKELLMKELVDKREKLFAEGSSERRRDERDRDGDRRGRSSDRDRERERSRPRSPQIIRVMHGSIPLRSLHPYEQRRIRKGDKLWAQDMKTGKWMEGEVTRVTDQGRVNLQVGIASWKKALDTVYKKDDSGESRDKADRYGSSSTLSTTRSWEQSYPSWTWS